MGNSPSRTNKRGRWLSHRSLNFIPTPSPTSSRSGTSTEIKPTAKLSTTTTSTAKVADKLRNTRDKALEPVVQHTLVGTSQSESIQIPFPEPPGPVPRPSDMKVEEISDPTAADLRLAAVKFAEAARKTNLAYAIVGGVSALIFGAMRPTSALDVLYVPNASGPLVTNDPSIFAHRGAKHQNPVVLISEDKGIPLNLINCQDTKYRFPELHGPTHDDGSPLDGNDPEATWDYQAIRLEHKPDAVPVKVLLPRLLLQQRLLNFPMREGETDPDERKKKDIIDIATYLKALFGSIDESFKSDEVEAFMGNVREVMRFAEKHGISQGLDVAHWRWIMIRLAEGDWRDREGS